MTAASPRRSRTNALRPVTRYVLWARSAGRCQYEGCNKPLIGDLISGNEDRNYGFVAHIVADTPGGPRGDAILSAKLSDDVNNLMLLCHVHHKLIDDDDPAGHPVERLAAMKAAHERRIETVGAIEPSRASHVLRYAANIGGHQSIVAHDALFAAMLPERYPADGRRTIDIELLGSGFSDAEPLFWSMERDNLRRQFASRVAPLVQSREIRHLSVFALAPQPLLVELGRLLGDIGDAEVRQPIREPKGWSWPHGDPQLRLVVTEPEVADGRPVLIIGVSATVTDERAHGAMEEGPSIWRVDAVNPNNDIVRHSQDLTVFRSTMRRTLDAIKAKHGSSSPISVLPAMPASCAVELGRVWMPKADLPMCIYDEQKGVGFAPALVID